MIKTKSMIHKLEVKNGVCVPFSPRRRRRHARGSHAHQGINKVYSSKLGVLCFILFFPFLKYMYRARTHTSRSPRQAPLSSFLRSFLWPSPFLFMRQAATSGSSLWVVRFSPRPVASTVRWLGIMKKNLHLSDI